MAPDLDLFNCIYQLSESLGYKVYDYKRGSPDDTPYIELIENETLLGGSKDYEDDFGISVITIHLWGDYKQGPVISKMAHELVRRTRRINGRYYSYSQIRSSTSYQSMGDNSTGVYINHGVLILQYHHSRRKT